MIYDTFAPQQGDVISNLALSEKNLEFLSAQFSAMGLGSPDPQELRYTMQLLLQDVRPFAGQTSRTEAYVVAEVTRLNAMLLNDMAPEIQAAKQQWLSYQTNVQYGQLIWMLDRPEDVACKRKQDQVEIDPGLW